MAPKSKIVSKSESAGDCARKRLVEIGLDMFGQLGFEGVSVRQVCDKAGMNVASVNYHFGSKEGLYIAVADHIIEQLKEHTGVAQQGAAEFLASGSTDTKVAMDHLMLMVENFIELLIPDSKRTQQWARFISRFQIEESTPDHGLSSVPFHSIVAGLIGVALNQRDKSRENAILSQTIFGQILVFRVNRLSSRKALGVKSFGKNEVSEIKDVVLSNIRKILI